MKVALNIIHSLGTLVSSPNKTDSHDVTEILLKVALITINHQYHIICMQNIYDNQFHCNIIFLIQIFLENCFNFTFQCNFTFQWITIESDYFPDGLPAVPYCFMGWRIWISTRWGHTSFIILFQSNNTYLIWNKPSFGRKYQCHQSRQLVVFHVPNHKKYYQSDYLFHISF